MTANLASAAIAAVRVAYAFDLGRDAWRAGLCRALAPIVDLGMGVSLAEFQVAPDLATTITGYTQAGGDTDFAEVARAFQPILPPTWVEAAYLSPGHIGHAFHNDILTADEIATGARFLAARTDIVDIFGASAALGGGRGVCFAAPMREVTMLSATRHGLMRHVLAHVRCATRLRDRLARSEEGVDEAVIDPQTLRVVHAEGPARDPDVRERLRHHARAVDRAHARAGDADPDGALTAWTGLVDGTWSIIDRFDTDGRRYLVAKRNPPSEVALAALTRREQESVVLAATGAANKLIAYELGVSPEAVSTHIRNAKRKLGCRTRVELVNIARIAWREDLGLVAAPDDAGPSGAST